MLEFKKWLLEDESLDPPDENQMDKIRNTPLTCDFIPHWQGDIYKFTMPMGNKEEFMVQRGGKIGLKAAPGSLSARCFKLLNDRDYVALYAVIKFIRHNNNQSIRKQLIYHKSLP